ncbi:MAG: hypothetical protein Q8P41_03815 [Pseudomonadota bacterium]|nr:hypothetical protein [Pseudomonadota bacterium]
MRLVPALFAACLTASACLPAEDTGEADTSPAEAADTDTDTDTDGSSLSYVDDVYLPFLKENCGECHVEDSYVHPPITADASHLVGVPAGRDGMAYVTPGSLETSFLWFKVNDRQDEIVDDGTRMPPPPEVPLPDPALAAIEAWIEDGAAP